MNIDAAGALTLAAVIEQDLRAVDRLESHALSLDVNQMQRAHLDSLGFALHNICNALEKMFLDLPPLRGAVLVEGARPVLSDLLRFRHLFRHAYEFTLDAAKTTALWRRWQGEGSAVKNSLAAFAGQLRAISAEGL